jgi:hypothetical protein
LAKLINSLTGGSALRSDLRLLSFNPFGLIQNY